MRKLKAAEAHHVWYKQEELYKIEKKKKKTPTKMTRVSTWPEYKSNEI